MKKTKTAAKKAGTQGFTAMVLLFVIVGLGYYTYLNNRAKNNRDVKKTTEEEQLLNYDFVNDYPKTVRETVKLHCRYLKSVYSGVYSEDELFTINKQIRQLFDDDLLEYNSEEKQLQGLKDDIKLYDESKRKFLSYTLTEASQIEYNTENDREYAKMKVTIGMRVDTVPVSADEEYILRKDAEGRWKILGWQVVNTTTKEQEGATE